MTKYDYFLLSLHHIWNPGFEKNPIMPIHHHHDQREYRMNTEARATDEPSQQGGVKAIAYGVGLGPRRGETRKPLLLENTSKKILIKNDWENLACVF